ncbi:hypothetical protein [Thermoactinomyces mirandus]|uniref:Uncharacterized protein n=1 Tax=Thermoactinomyces mirandus TaxID=2756294 RepID=A0A7W1XPT2_9BACL|nr:hypothetical protein [Thermoactinomyces mirandus]MBA4600976.1 hypothetical protein [Thermoactinomyces mirandus]
MGKLFHRFLIVFLIIGIVTLNTNVVHAEGSFHVPEVQDDFKQFEQDTLPKQEQPVDSPPVNEEKGVLDSLTQPFVDAWNGANEEISDIWESTKESFSDFLNWLDGVLSKISNVAVDPHSARDWLSKQADLIKNNWQHFINEPGNYLYEALAIEDYKAAWDKLTSDPLGYFKDA